MDMSPPRRTQWAVFTSLLLAATAACCQDADREFKPLLVARRAEQTRLDAQGPAAVQPARDEAPGRPVTDMAPYGRLSLVDEVDCTADPSGRIFTQWPENASRVQTILGRSARVLPPTAGQAAYVSYRIGKGRHLRPGGVYVLAVEYPEDAPRSMVVINTGNETSRGFHTGLTVGDALHSKYVNNLVESIDVPLSGQWETWSLLFRLHDRFPERGLVRGPQPRPLAPEDGFDVTIAQFSAENMPMSRGAAVGHIRLYEVIDPEKLVQPIRFPPADLPRRHLFWREEMADGIIDRKTDQPGIANPLDWYRYKAELMRFLGMHTYSKDLLEFGACQHWDSTPYGGHDWVFFDESVKHLWSEIVALMGNYGFDVLPYYEYSGSKGFQGLGNQRRARPLTRDDAYTHISWIESANADITDPATWDDFRKMLDLTVVRERNKAPFMGVWLRPRGQMPVSFSDQAIARFAADTGDGATVTRATLRSDAGLYARYIDWWQGKRREFLLAVRDYLRKNGIDDAVVLFTGCQGEPGVAFHSWEPRMVTDRPDVWKSILQRPEQKAGDRGAIVPLTIPEVVGGRLYLEALTSPGLNWGDWEVQHGQPADDPRRFQTTPGILLTHAFNRNYTVASSESLDAYRTTTGLAIVRHYALNEHMMFDLDDKPLLGYFITDFERAGPYCMMAEALAMAHGDPTMIGYLVGGNFGRGFPDYVRRFNANYLALPALPSRIMERAADDPEVIVRRIDTDTHGTWIAVVNTSLVHKPKVSISLPDGTVTSAASGAGVETRQGKIELSLYPCQLMSFHIQP